MLMREIVLDTETTGIRPEEGHRLVELGCLELVNRVPTGKSFHHYFNPERDMPKEAEAIHGLSQSFLADKPLFSAHADEFLTFIGDSTLVIHNAPFDMAFINAEFARIGKSPLPMSRVVDTLAVARTKFPMGPNSLDALCKRYGIDNSGRVLHGALLDSELLADVYLELTGGRQTSLGLAAVKTASARRAEKSGAPRTERPEPLPPRLTSDEIEQHQVLVKSLGAEALWLKG
jgi:DNA polymerase III subunit epsilon